jgi:MOSC domain-containing protein YiiM
MGEVRAHRSFATLREGLASLPRAPRDQGTLRRIVRRVGEEHWRESLPETRLTPERGLAEDAWERRVPLNPDAQLSTMQHAVAELIANGQPLELFGDNLFLDLDLSQANLPLRSRLRVGEATLEVTPKAHTGCKKFRARFGEDALRFVGAPENRPQNLRGLFLRVVAAGDVRVGDAVTVLSR